jgi:epoxide hydrolase-like predicted phosphatase
MIKAAIFDVGGVLVRTTDHSFRRHWERELGLAAGESEEIVFNSNMGLRAQKGNVTDSELWTWVGQRLNLGDQLEGFRAGFWAGDNLDQDLVTYIRSLRPSYRTAIISNATDGLRETLNHKFKIADAFDLIIGSAEVKIMKPEHAIYQLTLQRLDLQPDETVFIDDSAHNIVAAKQIGMATIHFKSGVNVPAELARLGVHPSNTKEV